MKFKTPESIDAAVGMLTGSLRKEVDSQGEPVGSDSEVVDVAAKKVASIEPRTSATLAVKPLTEDQTTLGTGAVTRIAGYDITNLGTPGVTIQATTGHRTSARGGIALVRLPGLTVFCVATPEGEAAAAPSPGANGGDL